jgi:CheY-like chemotaxis protein
VRRVVTTMLRRAGYGVCTAGDGREVLRLFEQESMRRDVALVLLDMSMPGLSGRAVRHELSRLAPSLPVAYFTGYGLDCPEEVDGVIEKPVRPAGLLRSVRSILDGDSRRPIPR